MKNPLRHIALILQLTLLCFLLVPATSNTYAPFYIIDGNSMQPAYAPGNIAFAHRYLPKDPDKLIGRVIVFLNKESGKIIVHRVIAVDGEYLKTKGDNNTSADTYAPAVNDILGIVYTKI